MRYFSFNDFLFILAATQWTILLSLLAFALGGLLGGVIAVLRISKFAPVQFAAAGYVQLFQGTPLLMQLFLIYYGLRSEEHTSELQSPCNLVCRLLLEKKKNNVKSETPVLTRRHSYSHTRLTSNSSTLSVS